MVTKEALAERKAALKGDPGIDGAVKSVYLMMHSAQRPNADQQPVQAMESDLSSSAVLLLLLHPTARLISSACWCLAGGIGPMAHILFMITLQS